MSKKENLMEPLNDKDNEIAVLCSVLNRERTHKDIFELEPADFDNGQYRMYFKTMKTMYENNESISLLTVRNRIQEQEHRSYDLFVAEFLNSYLYDSIGGLPSSIERLKDMSKRRMVWHFSQKAVENVHSLAYSVEDIMLDTEKGMEKVSLKNSVEYGTFQGFVGDEFVNETDYVPTGLKAIDDLIIGLFKTDLNVLAAKTYYGKSSLALDIAKYNCCRGSVLLFSLEMSRKKISQRLVCAAAELEFHQIVHGLNESQTKRFKAVQPILKENLRNLKIYDDIRDFEKITRECKRQAISGVTLIIIDYLQLVKCNEIPNNRRLNISYMSNTLKTLAMELDVPILLLSQFSRIEDGMEPKLYHLKESGEIENDADVVIFIHQNGSGEWYIVVPKNRMGKRGKKRVVFEAKYFRFKDHTDKVKFGDTLPYK